MPLIPKTQTKTHNTKFSSPTKLSCKNQNLKNPKQKRTQIYNNPVHKSKNSIKKKKKKRTWKQQSTNGATNDGEYERRARTVGTNGEYERRATREWVWEWESVSGWVSLRVNERGTEFERALLLSNVPFECISIDFKWSHRNRIL